MASNEVILVEKNVAFKIPQQFPAIYREDGEELVALVTEYYKWLEETEDQSVYNNRRLFEYRDISSTLSSMLQFFKKKYLADLPALDEKTFRVIVKNILDLYRRKGTESGLKLFFRIFFEEDIKVRYPAKYMFKPSDSKWQTGTFLQLFSNDNIFYNNDGTTFYTYADLTSKNIKGSISKAKAVVDKINFIMIDNTLTPILYITGLKGNFVKYDDLICRINGEDISFGKLNGSASTLEIDLDYGGTTGHSPGEIFNITADYGNGGKVIVTETASEFTGTVTYDVVDGGFGYTIENTRLITSNQVVILENNDLEFTLFERLQQGANQGYVVGQNSGGVGLRMTSGAFVEGVDIVTLDRDVNKTFTPYNQVTDTGDIFGISPLNNSSPGDLYPDTSDLNDVRVGQLLNVETIGLISDVIGNFLNVPLNSSDYSATPPALVPMSGTASPVTINTALEDAFDLTPFEIGRIGDFINLNPGADYINDVWALARDNVISTFERYEQNVLIEDFSSQFSVGDIVSQNGVDALITGVNNNLEFITIRPYAYYGFNSTDSLEHKGVTYDIAAIERDYNTDRYGENADIEATTNFSSGRISKVKIINSGFGYVDGSTVTLTDDNGVVHARGTLTADSQGITEGFWGSLTSHINGYKKTLAEDGEDEYYDSKMRIQDSDYYQEFSYEILSTVNPEKYRDVVKRNVHLAGTKQFGDFIYSKKINRPIVTRFYLGIKEDFVKGGDPVVGPNQPGLGFQIPIRGDNVNYTVDTTDFTADLVM